MAKDADQADISLEQLRAMMVRHGVAQLLMKELSANDNAKNQPYLGGNLGILNLLPMGEIAEDITDSGKSRLKASFPMSWLRADGSLTPAPHAQLILYPQYPEIRLSGFLKGTLGGPNALMTARLAGRRLFLGITRTRTIVAYVTAPESRLAKETDALGALERTGVLQHVPLTVLASAANARIRLLDELRRIHYLDWINSRALRRDGSFAPCESSQCVGYTLEAELGVPRNGIAEPDFMGWEVKASQVARFGASSASKAVTLMTPEPTLGVYSEQGVEAFIRRFGYPDKNGRPDRLNFGGIFRVGEFHEGTRLTLLLTGFDSDRGKITSSDAKIVLATESGEIAAGWTLASLIALWNRKHARAVYVPAEVRADPRRQYRYAPKVRMGEGTDLVYLLRAIAAGRIYYDPGIKLEGASSARPVIKRRSQFRIKSGDIGSLYAKTEDVDVR